MPLLPLSLRALRILRGLTLTLFFLSGRRLRTWLVGEPAVRVVGKGNHEGHEEHEDEIRCLCVLAEQLVAEMELAGVQIG